MPSDVAAWTSRQGRKGGISCVSRTMACWRHAVCCSVGRDRAVTGCGSLASIRRRAFPLCRVMSGMGAGASRPGWRSVHQPSPLPTGYAHAPERHSFLHARPGSSSRCAQRRVDEARAPLERLLGLTNDLGPLAAEYNAKRQGRHGFTTNHPRGGGDGYLGSGGGREMGEQHMSAASRWKAPSDGRRLVAAPGSIDVA